MCSQRFNCSESRLSVQLNDGFNPLNILQHRDNEFSSLLGSFRFRAFKKQSNMAQNTMINAIIIAIRANNIMVLFEVDNSDSSIPYFKCLYISISMSRRFYWLWFYVFSLSYDTLYYHIETQLNFLVREYGICTSSWLSINNLFSSRDEWKKANVYHKK